MIRNDGLAMKASTYIFDALKNKEGTITSGDITGKNNFIFSAYPRSTS
ncbi:MAG: hypothetical protein QS721_08590 [Candidatus Endonucleobacter sp. (ex Gigantidas childressi)]|nr:hypothetical protein [Candidatus Endonucleobacter sp. (ex Gigantidas childressi)]